MNIYNTLSKQVEKFTPNEEGIVKMYTCGPTVYHYAHLGNLRTYVFEDVLEKALEYVGYDVIRVMNLTDVGHIVGDADEGEDKMAKSAKREGKSAWEIAEFYTRAFFSDADKLNIRKPAITEKATDHIDMYIRMIEKLVEEGYAYKASGNIYFDVTKAPDYYKLSGKNPDELIIGVRDSVEEDKSKRNPADFVLWFTNSKFENQEMIWDSPWGKGYPGWHIECSGIAGRFLGEYLDIHCGAIDAVFPHHTNEIAQSEAYYGHKWCNYWIHGEHLNDSTGKMSKSKGTFLTLSLLEEKGYNPLSYRYYCLSSHYRNQLVFTWEGLESAEQAYKKLKNKIKQLNREPDLHAKEADAYQAKFKEAIENDLNTSSMMTILYDVLKDDSLTDFTKLFLVDDFDKVLSLSLIEEEKTITSEVEDMILKKIEERKQAKINKDYALADKIRDELFDEGIRLVDTKEKTTYEIM